MEQCAASGLQAGRTICTNLKPYTTSNHCIPALYQRSTSVVTAMHQHYKALYKR
jgi:hypothetical protein